MKSWTLGVGSIPTRLELNNWAPIICKHYFVLFSSNLPGDAYAACTPHVLGRYTDILQTGIENQDFDIKFTNTELGDLKDDLTRLQQQNRIKDERIGTLQSTIEEMQCNMAMIAEVLATKPTVIEVQRALERGKGSTKNVVPAS